jgi:hypothetical protein
MPKGDPAGYLPSVKEKRRFGKKGGKGRSAPIQKSLRATSQPARSMSRGPAR